MPKKTKPAAYFKQQFESYDDMVQYIISSIVEDEGAAHFVMTHCLELFNHVYPHVSMLHHKLVVDCIYITCNALGIKITSRAMQDTTKRLFGFNIRPEPFKWAVPFIPTISAMLKCEIHDLPLRGASGETVGSGKSSRLS